MRSYSITASAKINLYLEILGDRPDGYHELALVLQSVNLADRVDLRPTVRNFIQVRCPHPQVPQGPTNLAYRAAELMMQKFPGLSGVEITIDKQIPVGAGLAGGSVNAAAVLVGLDLMWQLGLTQSELQDLGSELGADVPFCVAGGTCLGVGRGDLLSSLPTLEHLYVVLGKYRSLSVPTPWAYQRFRQKFGHSYARDQQTLESRRKRVHAGGMVSAIAQRHGAEIGQLLRNDLEQVVLPEYPEVLRLKQQFQHAGTLGAMMSGSGPTVFALVESRSQAEQVQEVVRGAIASPDLDLWIAQLTTTSIYVL